MHAEDVLNEPLFFNRQITVPINASAGSTAQKPLMPQEHTILLTAGITKVAHVQAALQLHQPQALTAFFFFFLFGRDGYSLHKRNDSNLKTM